MRSTSFICGFIVHARAVSFYLFCVAHVETQMKPFHVLRNAKNKKQHHRTCVSTSPFDVASATVERAMQVVCLRFIMRWIWLSWMRYLFRRGCSTLGSCKCKTKYSNFVVQQFCQTNWKFDKFQFNISLRVLYGVLQPPCHNQTISISLAEVIECIQCESG